MQDIRQSPGWIKFISNKGWRVVSIPTTDKIHEIQGFLVPLGILGANILKLQRSNYDPDWNELSRIKRKHRVISSVIEPQSLQDPLGFQMAGYHASKYPYLPTKTYVLDLTKSEKEILAGLSQSTRRQILKNKNIEIEEIDTDTFYKLWKMYSKIWVTKKSELKIMKQTLGDRVRFTVSRQGGTYHSGLITVYSSDTANYYQTWTGDAGRRSGAHYKLVWNEILEAKKHGLKYFDFEGIFDSRWPQKRWHGFTEFKRRFGGKEVIYPGSFTRWL